MYGNEQRISSLEKEKGTLAFQIEIFSAWILAQFVWNMSLYESHQTDLKLEWCVYDSNLFNIKPTNSYVDCFSLLLLNLNKNSGHFWSLIILKIVHFTPGYPYSLYAWCFEENGEYQRNSIACFACIIYISILEIFKYFQDNQAAVSAWTFGPKSLNYYLDPWCTFWAI